MIGLGGRYNRFDFRYDRFPEIYDWFGGGYDRLPEIYDRLDGGYDWLAEVYDQFGGGYARSHFLKLEKTCKNNAGFK